MRDKKTGLAMVFLIFLLTLAGGAGICAAVLRWSEAGFYERAAAVAAAFPEERTLLMGAIKEPHGQDTEAGKIILERYGYSGRLLDGSRLAAVMGMTALISLAATAMIALVLLWQNRRQRRRLEGLVQYLRRVEQGDYPILPRGGDDMLSILEDEISKTVTELRETREAALRERERLAGNLADISHQLKTPLTSIALTTELLSEKLGGRELAGIERIALQADRLSGLVASLLSLSRMDAGALAFTKRQTPAAELASCAAAPVQALLEDRGQTLEIRAADCEVECDLGWTAEALGNIIKNCSEHSPEGAGIAIEFRQNPIFTEIAVEDDGPGFSREELPHVFERFYKGKNTGKDHIGIGLALAKGIVENQNGSIQAENRREGGARFVIRFYGDGN